MSGSFEIYKDNSNRFRWCLRDEIGRIVVTASDTYQTNTEAIAAAEAAKGTAARATVVDRSAAA